MRRAHPLASDNGRFSSRPRVSPNTARRHERRVQPSDGQTAGADAGRFDRRQVARSDATMLSLGEFEPRYVPRYAGEGKDKGGQEARFASESLYLSDYLKKASMTEVEGSWLHRHVLCHLVCHRCLVDGRVSVKLAAVRVRWQSLALPLLLGGVLSLLLAWLGWAVLPLGDAAAAATAAAGADAGRAVLDFQRGAVASLVVGHVGKATARYKWKARSTLVLSTGVLLAWLVLGLRWWGCLLAGGALLLGCGKVKRVRAFKDLEFSAALLGVELAVRHGQPLLLLALAAGLYAGACGKVGGVHNVIDCPLRLVLCSHGCGLVHNGERKEHEKQCPERTVSCPNSCGIQLLKAKDKEDHLATCGERIAPCPNRCGMHSLHAADLRTHLAQCPANFVYR